MDEMDPKMHINLCSGINLIRLCIVQSHCMVPARSMLPLMLQILPNHVTHLDLSFTFKTTQSSENPTSPAGGFRLCYLNPTVTESAWPN
jgi:hypothetical protein